MWGRTITLLFGRKLRTSINSHFSFFLWINVDLAQIWPMEGSHIHLIQDRFDHWRRNESQNIRASRNILSSIFSLRINIILAIKREKEVSNMKKEEIWSFYRGFGGKWRRKNTMHKQNPYSFLFGIRIWKETRKDIRQLERKKYSLGWI